MKKAKIKNVNVKTLYNSGFTGEVNLIINGKNRTRRGFLPFAEIVDNNYCRYYDIVKDIKTRRTK